jgi:exonuclease VII large subunit
MKNPQRQYTATIHAEGFNVQQFKTLQPGQWVSLYGNKGQYLGVSRAGVVVVNYRIQQTGSGTAQGETLKQHLKASKPLRQFAKIKGNI